MLIDFNINRTKGIIFHVWEGYITDNYLYTRMRELTQLRKWTFGLNHIIDIRTVDLTYLTNSGILRALSQMIANTLRNSKGEIIGDIAFLTNKNKESFVHEKALFKLFSEKTKRRSAIFYDEVSLYQWMNDA